MPPYKRKANGQLTTAAKKRKLANARWSTKKAPLRARVNKIINFIKKNKPETKKAVIRISNQTFKGGDCVTWNLMAAMMSQGVGEGQFTGKSINLKGIGVKIWCRNESYAGGVNGYSAGDQKHIWSIIGHKDYANLTSLGINDLAATEYGTFSTYFPHYDADKVKIYKQTKVHHRPDAAGVPPAASAPYLPDKNGGLIRAYSRSMYVPMNRTITFERYSTDYKIKGLNLYFLAQSDYTGFNYSGLSEFYAKYTFDITLYYTDD